MSAPVDVLAVMDQDTRYLERQGFENATLHMREARAAAAELLAAAEHFARGMPLSLADNTAVIGGVNAQALERLRAAVKSAKGVQP